MISALAEDGAAIFDINTRMGCRGTGGRAKQRKKPSERVFLTQGGKVYLVGAGPGHPELLTLKAAELLGKADVVVYDRLIQEEVLALSKPSAERLYMGKPLGRHDSRQEEVHELLVRKAREGKMVVRLKGGDPYVFGRGGEEAEYLADHGVPFEVIPGVTSAFAAPLSAGISVTHRNASSTVAIVTGHEAKKDHNRVDWSALARIETLIFLMGVNNVRMIADSLIAEGMDPQTPAAMIQMAFWHDERAVFGTLATMAAVVEEAQTRPPATLVIGKTVGMREKLVTAERDLRRRVDGGSRFQPAPAPDQLLRLAAGGLGSQVLGFSMEHALFDRLEQFRTAGVLARELGLNEGALGEILAALVALGVIEERPEGYRNLELASRYLRVHSPDNLHSMLLHQATLAANWSNLSRYAREGCPDFIPVADEELYEHSCEALARFAAPSVVERLDLGRRAPVLLLGWGGAGYGEAVDRRWPGLEFATRNPFIGDPAWAEEERAFGTIILSGLLASSDRGEVQLMLENSVARLADGGFLVLHDAFVPAGALPPPEVVLGSLGRRMYRGGCRTWSIGRLREALEKLRLRQIHVQQMPAATTLVTAERP